MFRLVFFFFFKHMLSFRVEQCNICDQFQKFSLERWAQTLELQLQGAFFRSRQVMILGFKTPALKL